MAVWPLTDVQWRKADVIGTFSPALYRIPSISQRRPSLAVAIYLLI
ncbi:hypothetical protein MRBBS_0483 [Marinobacter sp. BSs20148]|nr:hypothetical protein MRBBS_0483 [Marinobacter sp. BSs20148]